MSWVYLKRLSIKFLRSIATRYSDFLRQSRQAHRQLPSNNSSLLQATFLCFVLGRGSFINTQPSGTDGY